MGETLKKPYHKPQLRRLLADDFPCRHCGVARWKHNGDHPYLSIGPEDFGERKEVVLKTKRTWKLSETATYLFLEEGDPKNEICAEAQRQATEGFDVHVLSSSGEVLHVAPAETALQSERKEG